MLTYWFKSSYPEYPRRVLWLLGLMVAACCLLAADSRAQSGTYAAQLNLRDDQSDYNLAPYVYVTEDPGRSLTYTSVVDRHMSGKRGDVLRGKILTLGASSVPHWIIASISNQSQNENWILNFGEHLDGRIGLIDKIFIYDRATGRGIIDTVTPNSVPGARQETFESTAVPIRIASGSSAILVMYVVPRAGIPLTLGFNFLTQESYLKQSNYPLKSSNVAYLLFSLVIGFYLATMISLQRWGQIIFILYYAGHFLLFALYNNLSSSQLPGASDVAALMMTFVLVMGYLSTQYFFDITRQDGLPFRIIVAAPLLIAAVIALASFLLPDHSALRHVLLGLCLMGGYLFLIVISMAQIVQGKQGAWYMAAGWLALFLGAAVSMLSVNNIITPNAVTIASYWYMLVVQGFCLAIAVIALHVTSDTRRMEQMGEKSQEADHVVRIAQARENQEFNRLKRLVEHERQVMQELRDREVQQNEEMRKARVAADEANQAKSAFLAVVSHEIRTPMTGIMGMVRLLLDTALSSSQKDYAQTIQDSGDAMMSLLNDILDFEKIESGKMDLERIDFDLHRLANSVITLMSGHATNKGIYLRLNMDSSIPRYVVGDPVRLRQVMLNLVGNSIKFTKEGGVTLELSPEPNSEGLARGKMYKVRFAVRDTGVGISKEAQHNLFRPFSQADSSVSRKFGGTGLGLAISQRLIEAMGGRISIDSEEGRGSTFHFTLILEEGQAENAAEGEGGRDSLSTKSSKALRILVVEDNEINQKLLKEFIGRMGHEVLTAMTGEDGIEMVAVERPHMVLMDVELPGISGMGATKAIRAMADDELAVTPVIALTGNTREDDIRSCYAANMNGHLAKPVDPLRLRQMIDKVISGKLDNPVQVASDRSQSYVHTTQLSMQAQTRKKQSEESFAAAAPPPAAEKMEEAALRPSAQSAAPTMPGVPSNQSPLLLHLMQEDMSLGGENPVPAVPESSSALTEKPMIADLALQEDATLVLGDDDLDEDTFAQAMEAAGDLKGESGSMAVNGAHKVFERAMLDPLKGVMKDADLQEMIDGLLDKAEEIVLALDVAVNARDVTAVIARAHELKGMAGNFGLVELSKIAEIMERSAKDDVQADVGPLMKDISPAYKRARAEIMAWMQE
ncbi:MAG: response regulator [Micavibrio aeruginosavorus]|uniref:histidine kinase n=1 Tax=Micavibrio aeruginosavorus TaxID=349221 RepID=A0A7T5UH19_9BACT|nr:MAG: response regulator [Micavibrio aeruginosavorus]